LRTALIDSKPNSMFVCFLAGGGGGGSDVPALKQHYDRVLVALQQERDALMAEKVHIMQVSWLPSSNWALSTRRRASRSG
jgi:hypothetical protein